ncbi:DUF1080 domain-containing protein [Rubrivirga sp. S365]|uniref:DUF1080 domain-containing protein n=1 Tax=Rubrivirga litoralis TaxID=3075598 RepID=A0ABU3BPA2_9BACT|nr:MULTISPECIES: DUF1080 domain-containing protein [unclassified Rubrivirga]MDT0631123.1 DUF1080 domain-containing protein [Rubrivirga sp. F394]MDT7855364.1 DUF1080 domain-containing protein [Rubrivirga sp. S365]
MLLRPALALAAALGLGACATTAPPPAPAMPADEGAPPAHTLPWRQHDVDRPAPPRVEPAASYAAPPADATVLIPADPSGPAALAAWEAPDGSPAPWRVEGGAVVVEPGSGPIQTTEDFGDLQLHVEWRAADEPAKTGQDRSNSGVFLIDGRYEVQILDTYDNATYPDGMAGAIYGQFPPLANALRPSGEWQAYDVFFRGPRFGEGGVLEEPARLTVLVNGVLVQNNELLPGMTIWLESLPYAPHPRAGAIQLQDHGSPVQFRNLWVRETPDRPAPPAGYAQVDGVDLTDAQYDRLVGTYDRDNNEGQFVIERTDDGLGLSMPWRPGVLRMVPTSPSTFRLAHTAGRLTFDVGADGRPAGLTFDMGGGTYRAAPAGGAAGG